MTSYLNKSFSVMPGQSDAYRDGWDRVFGPVASAAPEVEEKPTRKPDLQVVIPVELVEDLLALATDSLAVGQDEPPAMSLVRKLIEQAEDSLK